MDSIRNGESFFSFLAQGIVITINEMDERTASYRRKKKLRAMRFLQEQELAAYRRVILMGKKYTPKRFWKKKRSDHWWRVTVPNDFLEEDWLENFRMKKSTFQFICARLRKYLTAEPESESSQKQKPNPPLTVEKKVAVALYKLASCAEYRVVANQFGTNKCVVHKCVYDVCLAIVAEFSDEYMTMPNQYACEEIAHQFEEMCGIPGAIGAIDGSHIPVLPPKEGYRDFVNRKGWPSYNMMAVVDSMYRFRYITCQHAGASHDAHVFKDSNLYKFYTDIIPQHSRDIDGVKVPYFLLSDPAYPLLPWVIKTYKGNLSPEEESFNVYHSLGRVVVENAFGRLKARFRCLMKRIDVNYKFVPTVVNACCILHNIVETRKDGFVEKWMDAVNEATIMFPTPTTNVSREADDMEGSVIRDALKNYMLQFPMKKSRLD